MPAEVNVLGTMLLIAVLLLMGANVMRQRRLARRDANLAHKSAATVAEPLQA